MDHATHTLVQDKDHIQARHTTIHSQLVIQTQANEGRDEEIAVMNLNINAIGTCTDIPESITVKKVSLQNRKMIT